MPNVGDIIRASDVAVPPGIVVPFYNVTLSGRYPIFWGKSEADTGWLVCDGGSDLHGGNVPNLTNKFIMGTNTVSGAKKTGGSTTTSSTSHSHTGTISGASIGATTLTVSTIPSHTHTNGMTISTGKNLVASGISATNITNTGNTGGSQSHTHSLTGTATISSSGAHTHTITPPYYTLIFCVKLP